MPVMVRIVEREKAVITRIRPSRLPLEAGNIRMGIRGSQGPKTKMINNIQGVMILPLASS
jgi:hypothetical protein